MDCPGKVRKDTARFTPVRNPKWTAPPASRKQRESEMDCPEREQEPNKKSEMDCTEHSDTGRVDDVSVERRLRTEDIEDVEEIGAPP